MISNNAKLNPKTGHAEKVQQILSVKKGIKFVLRFSGTLYHGQTLANRMNSGPSFQL
jgi:hypothetical protein